MVWALMGFILHTFKDEVDNGCPSEICFHKVEQICSSQTHKGTEGLGIYILHMEQHQEIYIMSGNLLEGFGKTHLVKYLSFSFRIIDSYGFSVHQ